MLLAVLATFLTGCGAAVFEPGTCPTWPVAGPAVAEEVERGMICPPTDFRRSGSGWGAWTSCAISFWRVEKTGGRNPPLCQFASCLEAADALISVR